MPATRPSAGSFRILSATSQTEGPENYLNITYQIVSGLPLDATVVVTPVEQVPNDLPVYVFYDLDYPTVATDWIFSAMLQGHLDAELRLRGHSNDPKLVNATELENILVNKETAVLIMASGGFPSNVFSKDVNLVKPWIDSGGILVWFGFTIGYYSLEKGMKKGDITWDMPQNPQENGSKMLGLDGFFEYTTNDISSVGVYSSPVCVALDVTYDLIQQAPLLQMVWAGNGLVLGKIGGPNTFRLRSSVSMVPVGSGKIILFGFFLMQSMADNGPELAARDIAQILCSGILLMNTSSIPWYQSYHLQEHGSIIGNCSLAIGPDVVGFEVLEYTSRDSDGILFRRQFVNAAGQIG
ncbi:MAG: hypothetical protein ABSC91_07870 [Candidatus Bathyarchaeia archaeon]